MIVNSQLPGTQASGALSHSSDLHGHMRSFGTNTHTTYTHPDTCTNTVLKEQVEILSITEKLIWCGRKIDPKVKHEGVTQCDLMVVKTKPGGTWNLNIAEASLQSGDK